ncbi:MAG: aminotransferase class I/II-fold pyridoxal phosphate-dependent enzyme [Candidatus Staskawiczbacteria bacterium]|nr:aminotransferase class I/II-fold pyridoxal phosphate-dependent enzyme [Candidatus Staskawiczbacteria bacterium]
MRQSRLPAGGTNLFQAIKATREEARAKGVKILDLSVGQPAGPALWRARQVASLAVLSDDEKMHEYQDNECRPDCIPNFAERFVLGHLRTHPTDVRYLPIPGIKPMLGLIPMACGSDLKVVATTTNPGYPTPRVWCKYLGKEVFEPTTNPENKFLFDPQELPTNVGLLLTNYPHNPSGAVSPEEHLYHLCAFCQEHGIRIGNDAAYAALAYGADSCCLADIAPMFPKLSWMEMFSASKLIANGTGWRIGAMVGSPDFIGDIATIKGNTDSGFVAPMAAGVIDVFENDKRSILAVRDLYQNRVLTLRSVLLGAGMRLALEPRAGFFTLWLAPKFAFGKEMEDAKAFNLAMIENTGVVGVHFPPYIRYAVAHEDVEAMAGDIKAAFEKAQVGY